MQVRDPVHNFLEIQEIESKLAGTPIFQRLRGIRQLGMANLVYPGALHTRFDHSLGVCHVAGLLAGRLGLADDEVRLVRVAALLHDLGHGPFSHVSEHALEYYANRDKLAPQQKKEKIHELITAQLVNMDTDISRLISQDEREKIVQLLTTGHGRPALRAIVSGPLDADKQDYLLRDSRFCGVPYGMYDIHQLHRSFVLGGVKDEEELMIDPDGLHAVEQYVLAKYYLTTSVYRHRVRLITDAMIVRAIQLGIDEDGVEELKSLYCYDGSAEFVANYQRWDDAKFLAAFGGENPAGPLSGDLVCRLQQRRLLKRVFSLPLKDISEPTARDVLPKIEQKEYDTIRVELEKGIADVLQTQTDADVKPEFVVVHAYTIKSVRESSRNDEGSIMVARSPKPRPFEEESALFASINEGYKEGYVEVYAPMDWPTEADKRKIRREAEPEIRRLIDAIEDSPEEGVS